MDSDPIDNLSANTKPLLIEAVIDGFLKSGYHHLTLYAISRRAKMTLPELRQYFQDKDATLAWATEWLNAFWKEKVLHEFPPLPTELPTDQLFAECFRVALLWGQNYPRYLRFGLRLSFEMEIEHPVRARYNHRGMEQILQFCEEALRQGQNDGFVRKDLQPRVVAYWVTLIITRLMDASVSPFLDVGLGIQGEFSCEVANASLDVLLRGLEPPRWFLSGGY
jgi:AcrR family transcriptional regulator